MRRHLAALVLLAACSKKPSSETSTKPALDAAPAKPAETDDRWAVSAVVGANLNNFVVAFANGGATLETGAHKLPLTNVTYTADKITFTLEKSGGAPWENFELTRKGDVADGVDRIATTDLPVHMVKLAAGEPARGAYARPQTPQPPFAYEQRELTIDAPDGGKLAGTLVVPPGAGPFPVLILLSGSGQEDRDETIYDHRPFLLIADALAKLGVASYRFDDRGTGKTTGAVGTLDVEIADAGAVVDAIKQQPGIDPARVGLLGHSAAGMVVPNVALKHPIAFAVLLAACTKSGRFYSAYQTERSLRATGASDADLALQREMQAKTSEAALVSREAAHDALAEAIAPKMEAAMGRKPTPEELEEAIAQPLAAVMDPWTQSYFRIDPADAWKQLSIPVLLLVGTKDTQVPAAETIEALQAAITKPELLTATALDGLNHLFQHAQTGELDEYLSNEETFDPAALTTLTEWIVGHASLR